MSSHGARFPKRVLARYADLVLRCIYQRGGRKRYVAVTEIEDAVGLERDLVLGLCRTRLLGEVYVVERLPEEVESSYECSPAERQVLRACFAEPHVRIRPAAVRLTEGELLSKKKRGRKKKKQ